MAFPRSGPLGAQVTLGNGSEFDSTQQTPREYAYHNWNMLINHAKDLTRDPNIMSRLFDIQRSSFYLLLLWWEDDLNDASAQKFLEQATMTGSINLNLVISLQFAEMVRLWEVEFLLYLVEPINSHYLTVLHGYRQDASRWTVCQRISRGIYRNIVSEETVPIGLPRASHLLETAKTCIEPCPWLPISTKTQFLPFYLWDIREQRTVTADDFGSDPQYVAISHTWGRWRFGDGIHVKGVPWKVPQNTKFHVEGLPASLQDLSGLANYVWFDLLCIPQDRSPLALQEIARQASIFARAAGSIAWLSEIENWDGIIAAVEWLSIRYTQRCLNRVGREGEVQQLVVNATDKADVSTGLYGHFDYIPDAVGPGIDPSGWFTSLWTLQEACLRPDMLLCNRNWEALAVSVDLPITLASLISLAETCKNPRISANFEVDRIGTLEILEVKTIFSTDQYDEIVPRAVSELLSLFRQSGMDNLLQMSRLGVIMLGNQRHCQERRAEAIMSVLGVTEWFQDRDVSLEKSSWEDFGDNLIFGRYELTFIQEARMKLGALFFSALSSDVEDSYTDAEIGWGDHQMGTLLPFAGNFGSSLRFPQLGSR